jgi:hypothetical protein
VLSLSSSIFNHFIPFPPTLSGIEISNSPAFFNIPQIEECWQNGSKKEETELYPGVGILRSENHSNNLTKKDLYEAVGSMTQTFSA